jgi:hypothetical protein|tara:strand:- start:746 stop:961 length:216 start_codon:yes stop_codon:yes gene_type:complete
MEWSIIGWVWVGIIIGSVLSILVCGILVSSRQSDLEAENVHLRFVRDSLKEEIFRLDNQAKPKPRKRRKRG